MIETIEDGNLIRQSFVDSPAAGGVGRPGERRTARKDIGSCNRVAYVLCGIAAAWVTNPWLLQKQGAVPVCRNFNEIGGAVGQAAFVNGDTRLGGSILRKGKENCKGYEIEKDLDDGQHGARYSFGL